MSETPENLDVFEAAMAGFRKPIFDRLQTRADERDEARRERDAYKAQLDTALARITELEAQIPTPTPPVETDRQRLTAIRVFPHYTDTNFGNHDKMLETLGELGIKRVSGLLTHDLSPTVINFYRRAHDEHGIKSWFTVGVEGETLTTQQWDTIQNIVTGPLDGTIALMSGWNEPNHVRGGGHKAPGTWETDTAKHQTELWRRFGGTIPIGSPQLWSGNLNEHDTDVAQIAPHIRGLFDTTAWHLYPRGGVGEKLFTRFDNTYRTHFGEHPVVCTEAGYFTDTTWAASNPVTEEEQATYLPQLADMYVSKGYGISYFKAADTDWTSREGTFGLIRPDWSRKPAFYTLRDYLAG